MDAFEDDNKSRLKWAFKTYDRDRSGSLKLDELFSAMNDPNVNMKFPKDRLKQLFPPRACKNVNKISVNEFVHIASKQPLLEMPVRMIAAKVKALVFDYEPSDGAKETEWDANKSELVDKNKNPGSAWIRFV